MITQTETERNTAARAADALGITGKENALTAELLRLIVKTAAAGQADIKNGKILLRGRLNYDLPNR